MRIFSRVISWYSAKEEIVIYSNNLLSPASTRTSKWPEQFSQAGSPLLLRTHCAQAFSVQLEQMGGVLFGLGGGTGTLKSYARRCGSAVPRGHGDELHQIQCDILIAARVARTCGGGFIHESFSSSRTNGYVFVFEILVFEVLIFVIQTCEILVFEILHDANYSARNDSRVRNVSCVLTASDLRLQTSDSHPAQDLGRTRSDVRGPKLPYLLTSLISPIKFASVTRKKVIHKS